MILNVQKEWIEPTRQKENTEKIKKQIEILEMEYIVTKFKNSIDKLTSIDEKKISIFFLSFLPSFFPSLLPSFLLLNILSHKPNVGYYYYILFVSRIFWTQNAT